MNILQVLLETREIMNEMGGCIASYIEYMESAYEDKIKSDPILKAYTEGLKKISKELNGFSKYSESEQQQKK